MITVRETIELLQKCNPDAIVRIAQPDDNYSENVDFIQEVYHLGVNFSNPEVHFCNSRPDFIDGSFSDEAECWIEVLAEEENFGRIKLHRAAPPKLST